MDQRDRLEEEDGRFYAIDRLGAGTKSIATSERLRDVAVSFGLPSGPALFLHLAHRAHSALRATDPDALFDAHEQGIWPDDHGPLFDHLEGAMAHTIFSYTAIEAFANESIPDSFEYTVSRHGRTETLNKAGVERRVGLDQKLHSILPSVLAVSSPKGTRIWERYRALKRLRDRLIHLKAADRRSTGPDDETVWCTLLKSHGRPWCDYAHALIGHFDPAVRSRRWFGRYPYE